MSESIKLPIGIDDFEKIRKNGFYYVDKTNLIEQLFSNWGEVNLFTRASFWENAQYEHVEIFL